MSIADDALRSIARDATSADKYGLAHLQGQWRAICVYMAPSKEASDESAAALEAAAERIYPPKAPECI